jgi:hypothetical protein
MFVILGEDEERWLKQRTIKERKSTHQEARRTEEAAGR